MPNNVVTIDHIASAAIANLYENTVAAQLVHRDYSREFVAGRGRRVSFRRPARFVAKDFDPVVGVEVQDINEDTDDILMNRHKDVSFGFGTVERTLDIVDYNERFVVPACEAISQAIDNDVILTGQAGLTTAIGDIAENDLGEDYKGYAGHYPWSDSRVMIEAGEVLNKRSVPGTDRVVLAGPTTAARWEAEQTWRHADKSGSTEGLREGSFGMRKHGFTPYMSQNIAEPVGAPEVGTPSTEVSLAFHPTAISLVTRPLVLPEGAQDARIIDYKGFGLRIVQDYDAKFKKDMISIDVLYGVKVINPERGVKIRALAKA